MSGLLTKKSVEKVWGRSDIPSYFEPGSSAKIGEVWFEQRVSFPNILVKYLFTSDKLSVQVYPSDVQAQQLERGQQGKEECWLVLDAEPGAAVALGLDKNYEPEAVRQAALDGSIEDMLVWHEARAGDFFHVPPGTIHAIGAGLTLLEVQQNTDITFRLFDYGRPRELHLDQAMTCAQFGPYDASTRSGVGETPDELLLDCPTFHMRLLKDDHCFVAAEPTLVVPLEGSVAVNLEQLPEGSCAVLEVGDRLDTYPGSSFVIVHDNQPGAPSK
ncbi:class I mannose-6-phosphate isomerase [Qipengyuania sp. CAU 1752]